MEMTGGTSATTTATNHVAAGGGNEYRQILPTVEVLLINENDRRSLGNNKAAAGGR